MRQRAKQLQGEVTIPVSAKLPPHLKNVVKKIADEDRRSLSNMMRILVEESPRVRQLLERAA